MITATFFISCVCVWGGGGGAVYRIQLGQYLRVGHIKMPNLVELWGLLALFLSKYFDQVKCS